MSLHSYSFDLRAIPPRSVFSIGKESTRARFPDFATVSELDEFLRRLFCYKVDQVPALFIQMKVAACLISVVLLIIVLIIGRRMYEQSFWLVRVIKRDSGSVIVPNAMLSFSIIEGVFAITFIALQWVISYTLEERRLEPFHTTLWILLPWCPLIVGAIWATWGTYFAIPPQLVDITEVCPEKRSCLRQCLQNAYVTNFLGTCIPILVCTSVVIPSIYVDRLWTAAQKSQRIWQAKYANESSFSHAMVLDAQSIWYEVLRSMKLCSATFVVWAFWALLVVISYHWVCWSLIKTIRGALYRKDTNSTPCYLTVSTRGQTEQDEEKEGVVPGAFFTRSTKDLASAFHRSVNNATTRLSAVKEESFALRSHGLYSMTHSTSSSQRINVESPAVNDSAIEVNEVTRANRELTSNHDQALDNIVVEGEKAIDKPLRRTNWRRIRSKMVMSTSDFDVATTQAQRRTHTTKKKDLQKAYTYIMIQFAAIGPASVCFLCLAVSMAVVTFGGTEQPHRGGTLFEPAVGISLAVLCWVTCVFGGLTFIAIALRTYEPVFGNIMSNLTNSSNAVPLEAAKA